jgi:hypothetical protein
MFEEPSRLATIEQYTFSSCQSLNRLFIPASVTAIHDSVFDGSGISSIEIEEGSVSFRVENDLLVDFCVRSLVLVIGCPESIVVPSSIAELRRFCCFSKPRLSKVEFESGSRLRSIGEYAFSCCRLLESISIPSSVEFLCKNSFAFCANLRFGVRTVTFDRDSKLRVIERNAIDRSVDLISVTAPEDRTPRVFGQYLVHLTLYSGISGINRPVAVAGERKRFDSD